LRPLYEMALKQAPGSPRGKVLGVVRYRSQLKGLCDCLGSIGIRDVEVLDGVTGVQRLDAWINHWDLLELNRCDREFLVQYRESLEENQIVFLAGVARGCEFGAMRLAMTQHAEHVHCVGDSPASLLLRE